MPKWKENIVSGCKKALKDKELIPEATVEHATLKELIGQIEGIEPNGEMFDAKIKVLSEYVKHHVKEEQNEIFPQERSRRSWIWLRLVPEWPLAKKNFRRNIHSSIHTHGVS